MRLPEQSGSLYLDQGDYARAESLFRSTHWRSIKESLGETALSMP